jgi:hypothetical protein
MKKLRATLLLLAWLTPFAAAGPAAGAPEVVVTTGSCKGYNLLLISITNIGTEHMSLYGYGRKTTPNLDKWAEGALVFENVYSPASWTLPVATSLFTSLPPIAHQIMGRNRDIMLSRRIKTMPEILRAAGYRTAAFTGALDYMVTLGHMRGFSTAPDNPPFTKFTVTVPQAENWLSRNGAGKFFLFVHGYDPHPPFLPTDRSKGVFSSTSAAAATVDPTRTYRGYLDGGGTDITAYYHEVRTPPAAGGKKKRVSEVKVTLHPADVEYLKDLYDEEVLDVDREVGEFLASLDKALLDRTIVVVLSEHGEMFAKHGRFGRAGGIRGTLYDDVVHVPLLIRLPGVPGKRIKGMVQLVDVMPTLMELLGVPLRDKVQGVSLLPLVNSGSPVNSYVCGGTRYNSYMPETYGPYGMSSINEYVRDDKWKLIHEITFPDGKGGARPSPEETYELYSVPNDPNESTNAAAAEPAAVEELKGKLRKCVETSRALTRGEPAIRSIPKEVMEKARQHGYW